jgi:hypothetical protein
MIPPGGNGEFIVQGANFTGNACEHAIAALTKKIGGTTTSSQRTEEGDQESLEAGQ